MTYSVLGRVLFGLMCDVMCDAISFVLCYDMFGVVSCYMYVCCVMLYELF